MSILIDLPAGFMDDKLLTEQMRRLSVLIDQSSPQAASAVVLPEHWFGFEDALVMQMNLLIAEMRVRGIATLDWFKLPKSTLLWPSRFAPSLEEQFAMLRERERKGLCGRIKLPVQIHDLWASFKYSVLARNHKSYLHIGRLIAGRKIEFFDLLRDLVVICRVPPKRGSMVNSVQHMWGYIAARSTLDPNQAELADLLLEVQRITLETKEPYLYHSTALGELVGWLSVVEGYASVSG
ncbi:MAG: hypothetical protein CSA50_04850 [Gammaproteobacteria bacterium]|nr:MAG: hypothetical protein CSA50_04850 [Gammaproteobacteria bacterium]